MASLIHANLSAEVQICEVRCYRCVATPSLARHTGVDGSIARIEVHTLPGGSLRCGGRRDHRNGLRRSGASFRSRAVGSTVKGVDANWRRKP